jgi:hypothetical protein
MDSLETVGWLRPTTSRSRWQVNPRVHEFTGQAQAEREARNQTKSRIYENVAAWRAAAG